MKDVSYLKTSLSSYDETYFQEFNDVGDLIILSLFIIFFCIAGLAGNGNIIWLLGFHIKRKPFAIYILNLSIADFGTLVFLLFFSIYLSILTINRFSNMPTFLVPFLISLFLFMHNSSQFLLTAISIDRWVSVVFPNWYRCHQSPLLSTTVCAFIWALSFAFIGVLSFLSLNDLIPWYYEIVFIVCHCLGILICPLLVIISTLTLFIKICLKSRQCQCGNLLKVILFMFLSFLLFTILANTMIFYYATEYFTLCICLKCSINPLIYFLAGKPNRDKFQERMKAILQRVFKEEKDTRMEVQPHTQTLL